MTKYHEKCRDRQPGEQKCDGVSRGAMTAPKINLGMDDEPVERNRQLRAKDDCREPGERRHAGILVEWRGGRQYIRAAGREHGLAREAQRHRGIREGDRHKVLL